MNEFACDVCGGLMGPDETGVALLDEELYGHVACLREAITAEELADADG